MNPQDVHAYLKSFIDYEQQLANTPRSAFKLDCMRKLLDQIGNPEKRLKIIHVAGSKGKGSVCAMTACILEKAGFKVGLYTSPHINHYRERIRILNGPKNNRIDIFDDAITDEDLGRILSELKPTIENLRLDPEIGHVTFYEIFTAIALYHFAQHNVDFVVLETGLGGRLDATNAAPSVVCAITPIGLEHTALLGNTIAEIAQEKAAIIKDHSQRVVIAKQTDEALKVIHERCRQFDIMYQYIMLDAQTYVDSRDLHSQIVQIQSCGNRYKELTMSLVGEHQLLNAKTAVAIIEALKPLGHEIPVSAIYEGLSQVFWPGRFEVIDEEPLVILDGAHTKDSIEHLVSTFVQQFPRKKATIILGVSRDKNVEAICKPLSRITGCVIATAAHHPRAHQWSAAELARFFPNKELILVKDVAEAFDVARKKTARDGVIVATGSIFLIGEVRECISLKV